jgi:hypothetical protein
MMPFLPVPTPVPAVTRVEAPVSDWDKARDVLVDLIHRQGGLGLLLSLEQEREGHLTVRFLERQSANSGWELRIQPVDPGPGAEQEPLVVRREGGANPFQMQSAPHYLRIAPVTEQLRLNLASQEFLAKVWSFPPPAPGAPPKVVILYLPKR